MVIRHVPILLLALLVVAADARYLQQAAPPQTTTGSATQSTETADFNVNFKNTIASGTDNAVDQGVSIELDTNKNKNPTAFQVFKKAYDESKKDGDPSAWQAWMALAKGKNDERKPQQDADNGLADWEKALFAKRKAGEKLTDWQLNTIKNIEKEAASWKKSIAAKPVDPLNPKCDVGHKKPYVKMMFGDSPIDNVNKATYRFFVPENYEIQPVAHVLRSPNRRDGKISVNGDGLMIPDTQFTEYLRTFCGHWVYNNNGMYEFEVGVEDASLQLHYFIRKRTLETMVDKLPINIMFQMDQSIIGDNNRLESTADIDIDKNDGIVTITLRNAIKGDGNESGQKANYDDSP